MKHATDGKLFEKDLGQSDTFTQAHGKQCHINRVGVGVIIEVSNC